MSWPTAGGQPYSKPFPVSNGDKQSYEETDSSQQDVGPDNDSAISENPIQSSDDQESSAYYLPRIVLEEMDDPPTYPLEVSQRLPSQSQKTIRSCLSKA